MHSTDFLPQFIIVIGGSGSGKNHFIEHHPIYRHYRLIDVDQIKQSTSVRDAIAQIRPRLEAAFEEKQNVVHPTTGANLAAARRKIDLAKHYGYEVTVILKDTDPEVATRRVAHRVAKGGHDVLPADIIRSNKTAKENFAGLSSLADKSEVVSG